MSYINEDKSFIILITVGAFIEGLTTSTAHEVSQSLGKKTVLPKWTKRQMGGQTNRERQTDRWASRQTNRKEDKWTDRWASRQMDEQTD
jgi:hypothetical protein